MKRDEETAQSKLFYENIPNLENKTVLLLDPMVATGGSLIDGIDYLKSKGAKKNHFIKYTWGGSRRY